MEIPKDDLVIIGGDLNAHVEKARDSYKRHHGGFGYRERNDEGEHVLKFTQAFDLALINTYYRKKDSHLITYESDTRKTQIRRLKDVIDCKVIPGEDIAAQHKLLVMDFHIATKSTQNKIKLEPCIKWDLSSRLIDTAKSTLGLTRGGNKSSKQLWWWNEEVQNTIQEKKALYKIWYKSKNPHDKTNYKKSKGIATKAVARATARAYDDMYE
ncbi:uncharacterized protein LOC135924306 [Gordionus sp. m RMFG-2023]|uniref:uncharacterized protein LOC135924306 n=1 Tax=Gordionus sp. m RMFG-2023 TaxID=3053472 RepID=UPI0031FD13CE